MDLGGRVGEGGLEFVWMMWGRERKGARVGMEDSESGTEIEGERGKERQEERGV